MGHVPANGRVTKCVAIKAVVVALHHDGTTHAFSAGRTVIRNQGELVSVLVASPLVNLQEMCIPEADRNLPFGSTVASPFAATCLIVGGSVTDVRRYITAL